ncbi:fibrous sheath-interacting protein 1-like [Patiria miniata]|uniref:Fibrous sheath-interacting protein 1 n=1 Tax=Patiria miniata TaxID=46514 RepID=A0A913Z3W8_PATMI|nr:fibrous sheath-interacting protein 1-like [Patiria miniata]XP_038046412.1 fibrous sheath-interacting protein 1-like [Patiria miniata]
MDITKGNLDEISRPASNHRNHQRPGSRVSLRTPSSAGSTRQGIDTSNSLEILPPESPTLNQQEFDLEVVELFSSDTDSECDVGNQSDDNKENTETQQHPNRNSHNNNGSKDSQRSSRPNDAADKSTSAMSDPLDSIPDPKIREAMKKMQQLDRILAKKTLKEKEVKRQRLQAHRDMERELQGLRPEGREEQREVLDNTSRYLALVPPASHSEGVSVEQEPVDPVFPTQPAEADSPVVGAKANGIQGTKATDSKSQQGNSTDRSSQAEGDDKAKRGGRRRAKGKGHNDTQSASNDFIQRNIDLASDAGNVIAMTDDEKKRLEELLQDVEMLVDEEEKPDSTRTMNALQLSAGVGYIPDATDQQALQDIDAKLKALLPEEDYDRISTTPSQERGDSYHRDVPGEKILKDTKDDRRQHERLKRIEVELEYLENRVEREIYKSPRLSQENLSELLEQCSELSSRAATETDSILQASPRSGRTYSTADQDGCSTQEATPRLPEDILQKLLAEARESCLSDSRLSSLTPISSLDTQQMLTPRSDGGSLQPFAVVSQSTIQELLRNPRATSTVASTTGMIMDIAGRSQGEPEEEDFWQSPDVESGQASAIPGTTNGYSESPGSGQVARPSSQQNTVANQNRTQEIWDAPSSPRHSQQSPQPRGSKGHPNQGVESSVQSSLSLRSFSNSTDFPTSSVSIKSPEPPPSRNRSITDTSNRPRMSAGSPEPSASSKNTSLKSKSKLSETFDPSPQPPSSRQTTRSSRSKKAKVHAQSSFETRGTLDTPAGHTDSRASTNTLVSSSDFEYEDDEEVAQQLLSRSHHAEITGQGSRKDKPGIGSSIASRSIEESVVRSIARFEKKGTGKERFSPPLV